MKYKLTHHRMELAGHTLYQIQALTHFNQVKKGDLGGWIESEKNLSQEGGCWIYDEAKVYGGAVVNKNAQVMGNACLSGHCVVSDNATIKHSARISDFVIVKDRAIVKGSGVLSQNVIVQGDAQVKDQAQIAGNIIIGNHDIIKGNEYISTHRVKYHLNKNETIKREGETLYQIVADISFNNVKVGEVGGYIADESCLSHYGNCWVDKEAYLLKNEYVTDDNVKVLKQEKTKSKPFHSASSSSDVVTDIALVEAGLEIVGSIIGSLFD